MNIFSFIKNTLELNNLAKVMMMIYGSVQELESEGDYNEADILNLTIISKRGILDRIDKNGWPENWQLVVPSISHERITIAYGLTQTVNKIYILANKIGCLDEVEEVLQTKNLPIQFEAIMQERIKNMPQEIRKLLV